MIRLVTMTRDMGLNPAHIVLVEAWGPRVVIDVLGDATRSITVVCKNSEKAAEAYAAIISKLAALGRERDGETFVSPVLDLVPFQQRGEVVE